LRGTNRQTRCSLRGREEIKGSRGQGKDKKAALSYAFTDAGNLHASKADFGKRGKQQRGRKKREVETYRAAGERGVKSAASEGPDQQFV